MVRRVAQHNLRRGLARDHAAQLLLVLRRDDHGVITFFNLRTGIKQRFDEIVRRRTRADTRHVRPDLAAGAANRVTHHAGEFRPAVNTFAPRRVTDRQRLPGERLQFFRRELRLGQRESGTLDQRLHQRLVLSALARGTQARLRHRRRQLCLGQLRRQSRTRALHRQQRAPQHLRIRLDRRRGQHPQHVRHRRRQIHARERHDRLALNRRTRSTARQRPQLRDHRRSTQFPQRPQGRRPLRRRGRHVTRTTHHHRRQRRQFPRTHERQRRDADRSRPRLQQGRQLRQIPFGFHAAQPRGRNQRAQGRGYRRLVKAVGQQGI